MKLQSFLFFLFAALSETDAFSIYRHCSPRASTLSSSLSPSSLTTSTRLAMESGNFEQSPTGQSRIHGNQREPTIQELSIMDDMITKLMKAKPYELPTAVSKAIRVVSSPRFFMRIAERVDIATSEVEKAQLSALASNLVTTIEAVVSTTEDKLDDRARGVETIVKAAAEPGSGEFLVPLSSERLDAMRTALKKIDPLDQDEGFLTTVDAWMNKSHLDGLDGMVVILQKVLQIYAGEAIKRARVELQANVGAAVSGETQSKADSVISQEETLGPKPAAAFMDKLMGMDTDLWDMEIKKEFATSKDGGVTSQSLISEVQRTMEAVVLGLENGSMAQRVQAEFLKELVTRIEKLNA
mmetsp:Transcript_17361/g.32915  ORF Transcript_17361/g.32915 Transcript_17361/m.32915 type:complete len:354 (+) Transcript_17361:129-1190(+)